MIPPVQDRSQVTGNDIAKVFATILVIIVVLIGLAFYMISLLDQAFQEGNDEHEFPHQLSRIEDIDPTRSTAIPVPVSFEILGNATGTQLLVVLDKTGTLTAFTSNDLFYKNLTEARLTRFEFFDLDSVRLQLGYLPNGSVGVHCSRGSFDWYWVQNEWNESLFEAEGPLSLTGPRRPVFDVEELPASDRIHDYRSEWNTIHLDGQDVVVAEFSDFGGCLEWSYCPGIAYRLPNGQWSNIVVIDETYPDGISIAGTSMEDMFVVTWSEDRNSVGWWFYPITDDSVQRAGIKVVQG